MDRKILAITIMFVVLALFVPPAIAGSSMMFRMDPAHSGDFSSVSGRLLPNDQLKWETYTLLEVGSSLAVADGVLYVATWDNPGGYGSYGYIIAINAADGTQKWSFPTGAPDSSPAVVDGVVYVGSYDGNVYALNAVDGTQKWAFPTGYWAGSSSPAVVDGVVYIGSWDKNVYAINAADGTQKWAFPTGGYVFSSPAVADGVVYVGSDDGNVYAINAADGTQKWAFPVGGGGGVYSSPAVIDGVVYVGSGSKVYAINAADGTQKWAFPMGGEVYSSPAVVDGVVYVGNTDHNVYAINAADGTQKWAFPTGDDVRSSPAVADGVVYIGSWDNVYAINAADGTQKWSFPPTGSLGEVRSPVVVDGVVYVGCADKIYAIGKKPTPIITWSNPADITYGTPLSDTQLNAVASVPGTFTYTPPAGTVLDVGNNQNLHVDFTPTDSVNYNSASMEVKINVLRPTTNVPVKVKIDPKTINLGSKGYFIAFVTLPEAYKRATINKDTVSCSGAPAVRMMKFKLFPRIVGFVFKTRELQGIEVGKKVTLNVEGELKNKGTTYTFTGSDTVNVIRKPIWQPDDIKDVSKLTDDQLFKKYSI